MLLAQLTDTHVIGPSNDEVLFVDNNGRLAEAVASLNSERPVPDVVVATGDLANWGRVDEYLALAELLGDLSLPLLVLPGNHDHRQRLRATFPDTPWADAEHASWAVTIEGVRIIGLDSTLPGQAGAEFDEVREQWLQAELDRSEGPTVLALHHPPFVTGIEWMDNAGFIGLDRLRSVLRQSAVDGRPVTRIICGHLHRPVSSAIAGVPAQVGLSTVQHVALDLDPRAGVALINDPVGYLLHRFTGESWVTHTRYIATGEAPYVPIWASNPQAKKPDA